jgi:hypothetical protein
MLRTEVFAFSYLLACLTSPIGVLSQPAETLSPLGCPCPPHTTGLMVLLLHPPQPSSHILDQGHFCMSVLASLTLSHLSGLLPYLI